jgi:Fe-S-cluster containining protein
MARRRLRVFGQPLDVEAPTSEWDVASPPAEALFAIARGVSERIQERVRAREHLHGRAGTCVAGCAACCEHLVPISTVEAVHLARVVAELPAVRRSAVERRFRDAQTRLAKAGMIVPERVATLKAPPLREGESLWDATSRRYRELRIMCPFLEGARCSIYEARPLVCREYVATTPAERCSHPMSRGVETMPRPVRMSEALSDTMRAFEPDETVATSLPLVLALRWAAEHGARAEATLANAGHTAAETLLDCIDVEEI